MTPAQPAGAHSGPGPLLAFSGDPSGDERSFAETSAQATPVPQAAHQKPAPQAPATDLERPGPAGEWADAVLSSALGTISNDALPSLR